MALRPAVPEDALSVARVHVRCWQAAYRNLLPAEYLDGLRPEDRASRYDLGTDPGKPATIVAVEDGAIVGFVTVAPERDAASPVSGEVCALYVEPQWWGRGVGRALIAHGRTRLHDMGFHEAILWVLAGNSPAQRFYCRDGWLEDGVQRTMTVWGATVDEIRYRRRLTSP